MRLIQCAMLACCLSLFPMAGLADGGLVIGDDGSIGGGDDGGEEPQDDPTLTGMTAVDATMKHLQRMESRLAAGTLPTGAQGVLDVSRRGHDVANAVHGDGLRGRRLAVFTRAQRRGKGHRP